MNLAWILSETDHTEDAVDAYTHGLRMKQWPAATAAGAHNNRGACLKRLGQKSEAAVSFRAALAVLPGFDAAESNLRDLSSDRGSFAEFIQRGNDAFMSGDNEEAEAFYAAAVPLRDPRLDGAAYVGLGAALHAQRRVTEALQVLSRGRKLNPASSGLLENLATVKTDLQQWKGAATAWEAALRLNPRATTGTLRAAAVSFQKAGRAAEAMPHFARAATLDPNNWQQYYAHAHALLQVRRDDEAVAALRPLHRLPISLDLRLEGAEPPWTRLGGRGILGDEPPPISASQVHAAQAARRTAAAASGRQAGVIVYKLGPQERELTNLHLSLRLLTRHFNGAFGYPVLVCHDSELPAKERKRLQKVGDGRLSFVRVRNQLPEWIDPASVPESVIGFNVDYRYMIRWKAGLMWRMPELDEYDLAWSLDTDSFILGPISYDVFAVMAAANATYGYMDVNVETATVAEGLGECVHDYLRKNPALQGGTSLPRFSPPPLHRWDGSKFYTNFQVTRVAYGRSAAYQAWFEHVDRSRGIFDHRWGADPFMFLAAALLLQPHQLVHFDDVPFLHQHLVANLPQRASPALRPEDIAGGTAARGAADAAQGATAATAGVEAATAAAADEADEVVAARPPPPQSTSSVAKPRPSPPVRPAAGGAPGALLFLSGAAHAAAAAHALARWRPARPGCVLRLRPCAAAALGLEARATALALLRAAVPSAVALAPLRLLDKPAATPGRELEPVATADVVGAAADMLLHMGAQLGGGSGGGGGAPATGAAPRLLLLCLDETDGLTLAASLAARLLGISALNVCDEDGVVDGVTPLLQASQHSGLQAALDAAADCPGG